MNLLQTSSGHVYIRWETFPVVPLCTNLFILSFFLLTQINIFVSMFVSLPVCLFSLPVSMAQIDSHFSTDFLQFLLSILCVFFPQSPPSFPLESSSNINIHYTFYKYLKYLRIYKDLNIYKSINLEMHPSAFFTNNSDEICLDANSKNTFY